MFLYAAKRTDSEKNERSEYPSITRGTQFGAGQMRPRRMKVCHIYLQGLSPQKGGGVATYLYGLIDHTHNQIDYSLITNYDRQDLSAARRLYRNKAHLHAIVSANRIQDALNLGRMFGILRYQDIVHCNDFSGRYIPLIALLRALSRTRLVFGYRTAGNEPSNFLARAAYRYLFIQARRYWDAIVCPSKYQARSLKEDYGVHSADLTVIPNGVDLDLYKDAGSVKLEGMPSILFVGHLEPTKGADLAIRAFQLFNERVPASRLHMVGGGRNDAKYKELARELRVEEKTRFHGRIQRERLPQIYKGADICLFPSRFEAFGNVLLEAMAAGKPIVATRIGGIPEIIKNGRNGLLVEANPHAIAAGLSELASDSELSKRIEINNSQDIRRYTWDRMAKRYVNLYEQVVRMGHS